MLSRMESNRTAGSDAKHWQEVLVFRSQPIQSKTKNWESIVFAIVFCLHAALISYGYSWQKDFRKSAFSDDEALQVSFIDRLIIPESIPDSGHENTAEKVVTARTTVPAKAINDGLVLSEVENHSEPKALRLTMDVDEWATSAAIPPRNPLNRQHIALAGRAEPFVHGIKFTNKLTPRQKLQMVGKLFGAVDYDPCKEARNRMASGESQQDDFNLEHDLQTIAHHCRP